MVDDNPLAPQGADPRGTSVDRLNSWKEIAAYLSKGVRTVQRWEVQMGLPVRRLGRERGEIVYALKNEIDAWILNGGHTTEADQSPEASEIPNEGPGEVLKEQAPPLPELSAGTVPRPAAVSRFSAPRWAWVILILVGIAGVGMTLGQGNVGGSSQSERNPVGAAYEGGVLRTWDGEGKPLWSTPLGAPADTRLDRRINPDPASGLRVFNADGSARFSHVSGRPVTFGSEAYAGFNTNALYVFRDTDGAPGLWVTAAHASYFPSVLQRLSPRGEVLSEYWSNGHIRTIRPARVRGRPFLLVGSYNNERHGGSLAFLDLDHPTGTAPAEKPYYRCTDCAEGEPVEFLVFPGADLMRETTQSQGSAAVTDARLMGDDVVVTVSQASANVPGEAKAVEGTINYRLSVADLSLRGVLPGWSYLSIRKTFERVGRMDHTFGPKDEAELEGIVRWSRGRFVPLTEAMKDPVFARVRETAGSRAGS